MQLREDAGLTWGRISGEGATEEGKEASNIQKEKGARFSDNLNERRRQVMEGRKGGREEGRLITKALFLDGQVDHGFFTVAKDTGRRVSCRSRMIRSIMGPLGLS